MVLVLIVFGVGACATVEHAIPQLSDTDAATTGAIRSAYDAASARRARVYDLAWPVLTANAELCPVAKPSIGIVLADRKTHARLVGGLREEDMETLGVPDRVHLYHVYVGSPAAAAGLKAGDIITAVGDKEITRPAQAEKLLRAGIGGGVSIHVQRGSDKMKVDVTGISRCDMAVKIAASAEINASAGTGDIVIYNGLIGVLGDEALKFVIAHEAAHLAARHPRKYVRNLVVSGAVVAGPVLYTGAWMGDRAMGLARKRPDVSLRHRTIRAMAPWAARFEAEADYLGAYYFARSGGDLAAAAETFKAFAREAPKSIYVRASHPLVPERLVALALVTKEIEEKRAASIPLLPNKRQVKAR